MCGHYVQVDLSIGRIVGIVDVAVVSTGAGRYLRESIYARQEYRRIRMEQIHWITHQASCPIGIGR